MLAAVGIRLIDWYQRVISPRKGFCCAHRKLHGRSSCSQFARRVLERLGFWALLPMMRRRFDRCRSAAIKLAKAEPYEVDDPLAEKEERKRRRAYEKSRFGDKRKTKKAGSCGGDTAYPDCYCPGSCDAFEGFEGCDLPAVDCSP